MNINTEIHKYGNIADLADQRAALISSRFSMPWESSFELSKGLYIVIPVSDSERVPIVCQSIKRIAEDSLRSGVVVQLVLAEYQPYLKQSRSNLFELAEGLGLAIQSVQVSNEYASAGHSLNEALRAIRNSKNGIDRPIAKLDDDSVIAPGFLRSIIEQFEKYPRAIIVGALTERVPGNLADSEVVQKYFEKGFKTYRQEPINAWHTLLRGNLVDCARLYGSFSILADCPNPNENGLTLHPGLVNLMLDRCGEVFLPKRRSGEGTSLYALTMHLGLGEIVVSHSARVLDRMHYDSMQRLNWGLGDAEFVSQLAQAGMLFPGVLVARAQIGDRVEFLHSDDSIGSIVVYPDALRELITYYHNSSADIQRLIPRSLASEIPLTIEYLDQALEFIDSDRFVWTKESPFSTQLPEYSFNDEKAAASLIQLTGQRLGMQKLKCLRYFAVF